MTMTTTAAESASNNHNAMEQQGGNEANANQDVDINMHDDEEKSIALEKYSQTQVRVVNVIFLDWDDTLCPTTPIFRRPLALNVSRSADELNEFAKKVCHFLSLCIQHYTAQNTYIVTNGGLHWVQYSLHKLSERCSNPHKNYFNNIARLLRSKTNLNGIPVISAKHYHQSCHSQLNTDCNSKAAQQQQRTNDGDGIRWKYFTFCSILSNYLHAHKASNQSVAPLPLVMSILCIGDSYDEYVAAEQSKKYLQQTDGVKHVSLRRTKLKSNPSIKEMSEQLAKLSSLILSIHCSDVEGQKK